MKEFFHASRDIEFLKSFLHEGAKAIGKGLGGQQDGFYVYEKKELAIAHFGFFCKKDSSARMKGGILVGLSVKENDIKYPQWQFDYEANSDILPLLEEYAPFMVDALKNRPEIKNAKKTNRFGRFEIEMVNGEKKQISPADSTIKYTKIWQSCFDELCQNPFLKKEYNTFLSNSPLSCKKYTGKKPLPVSYLAYMQPMADGTFKEVPLYTDKQTKEMQMCPFLKVHLAQASQKKISSKTKEK